MKGPITLTVVRGVFGPGRIGRIGSREDREDNGNSGHGWGMVMQTQTDFGCV